MSKTGYPWHRENRENGPKISLSGKIQGVWKFCQNTQNLFAQKVNALILNVKDIAIFAAKKSFFFQKLDRSTDRSVIVTNYVNWHRENLQSDMGKTENTGNLKIQFEWVPCKRKPS